MAVMTTVKGVTGTSKMIQQWLVAISHGMPAGGVNSSYRNPEEQARLFHNNYTSVWTDSAEFDPRRYMGTLYWRRKANRVTGGKTVAVAVPYTSKHNYGLALDFDVDQRAWMHKHGHRFGFINPEWAKQKDTYEPWHFEYFDQYATVTEPPKPNNEQTVGDDEMPTRKWFQRNKDFPLTAGKWTTVKINDDDDISVAIGDKAVSANVMVQVSGLPKGEQMQMRFFIDEVVSGKTTRAHTLVRSMNETTGTDGTTFFRTDTITGLTDTQRLRAEVWVPASVSNAEVISAGADALVWN